MTEPFKPDWDEKAVLVEEMQRMAKRIVELEQKVAARSAEHLAAHITHDKGYQEGRQDAEKTTAVAERYGIAKYLKALWCSWTHGGGTVEHNPSGLIDWQCNKCGRWCFYKEKNT
jgi:rubrerythrin